eukprot:scaffold849_cov386-Prasinococcus_capsulatus_cf.AAC.2
MRTVWKTQRSESFLKPNRVVWRISLARCVLSLTLARVLDWLTTGSSWSQFGDEEVIDDVDILSDPLNERDLLSFLVSIDAILLFVGLLSQLRARQVDFMKHTRERDPTLLDSCAVDLTKRQVETAQGVLARADPIQS